MDAWITTLKLLPQLGPHGSLCNSKLLSQLVAVWTNISQFLVLKKTFGSRSGYLSILIKPSALTWVYILEMIETWVQF
jgi:hypothetical protein